MDGVFERLFFLLQGIDLFFQQFDLFFLFFRLLFCCLAAHHQLHQHVDLLLQRLGLPGRQFGLLQQFCHYMLQFLVLILHIGIVFSQLKV